MKGGQLFESRPHIHARKIQSFIKNLPTAEETKEEQGRNMKFIPENETNVEGANMHYFYPRNEPLPLVLFDWEIDIVNNYRCSPEIDEASRKLLMNYSPENHVRFSRTELEIIDTMIQHKK